MLCDEFPAASAASSAEGRQRLIEAIVEHLHERQYDQMDRLSEHLFHAQQIHGARWNDLLGRVREVWVELVRQLSGHFRREETILFPLLACDDLPPLDGPLLDIMGEHQTELELLGRLAELTNGYSAPADACPHTRALHTGLATFDRDLRRHIQLEDERLFRPLLSRYR